MSIFGQVWLWSVAAFLVGVLLTWVLLVRPAQARSRALERRLQAAQAAASERQSTPTPPARAVETERVPEPPAVVERPAEEPAVAPEPNWYDREPVSGQDDSVFEPESEAEKTSIFKPYQKPEPERGSLFDSDDEAAERGALFVHEPEPAAQSEAERESLFGSEAEPEHGSLFRPGAEAEHGSLFGQDLEPERGHRYAPEPAPEESYGSHAAMEEPPAYAFGGGEPHSPVAAEAATEATAILPKRQPRSTPPSSFEPPRPSMRSIERREPVADEGGRSGSLFEPAVRPNTAAGAHAVAPEPVLSPPPARTPVPDGSIPPGPFGPGSAMPRPGGGRPSDEFAVKASVTALRYCTEDSVQFGRMVAEVWFRSPADAERVGFRPLS
jgi:hypothetical protein